MAYFNFTKYCKDDNIMYNNTKERKKKMKKKLTTIIAIMMLVFICGCGSSSKSEIVKLLNINNMDKAIEYCNGKQDSNVRNNTTDIIAILPMVQLDGYNCEIELSPINEPFSRTIGHWSITCFNDGNEFDYSEIYQYFKKKYGEPVKSSKDDIGESYRWEKDSCRGSIEINYSNNKMKIIHTIY